MQDHYAFAALLVAGLSTAGCYIDVRGEEAVVREEKRFTVNGPIELNLKTFDGSIEVRSWDRDEVLVEIERRGSDRVDVAALEVRATQDGSRIVVEAPEPRRRDGHVIGFGAWQSPAVNLIVTAPRRGNERARAFTVKASTGDGPIWAHDLTGTISLRTGDGDIRAEGIEGDLEAHTGDGSIDIAEAQGRFDLDSGDGSIEIGGRIDALRVRSGDGAVRVEAEPGSEMQSDWTITTGDGAITLRLPDRFDAEVDARSGDGPVRVEGLSGISAERDEDRPDEDEESRSLRGRLGNGGRLLRIRSGDGRIEITRR